jgi:hypothetical protein
MTRYTKRPQKRVTICVSRQSTWSLNNHRAIETEWTTNTVSVSVRYVCYMRHSLMHSLLTFEVKENFCCQRKRCPLYLHFLATTPHLRAIVTYSFPHTLSQSRRIFHCSHNVECNPSCPIHPPFASDPNSLKSAQLYLQPEHAAACYSIQY